MAKESCRSVFLIMALACLAVVFCFWSYSTITLSTLQGFTVNIGDPVRPDLFTGNLLLGKMTCEIQGKSGGVRNLGNRPVATRPGKIYIHYKLMGLPVKRLAVNAVSQVKVIPGGQSIGITMHSRGIMVVGLSNITDGLGNSLNPAEEAGIRVGDLIVSANGRAVEDEYQLKNEIISSGIKKGCVELEVKRAGKVFKTSVKTVLCRDTGRPRVGLFVRDTASGVGTISFYHESGIYGALGHVITDVDTSMSIDLGHGRITEATIRGIHRGKRGQPGEKVGMFLEEGPVEGNIEKNTSCGIFGRLKIPLENPYYKKPLPVALSYQIKKGPAEMLTVIDGTEVKKYSVEIIDVFYPWNHKGKGMIIKIRDQDLIKATGGIVQGMSGSPIIQDGMLVGVLTHVFINDPAQGYGVPAEWMLKEAGLLNYDKNLQKVS